MIASQEVNLGIIRAIHEAQHNFLRFGHPYPNVLLLGVNADQALFFHLRDIIPGFGDKLVSPMSCDGMQYCGANIIVRASFSSPNDVRFLYDPVESELRP